ncbi:hypothetical protein GCM10011490_11530 [Pseudoclavibacter endophyticus]|uniref:Uncharacterized protein n=1 Tax=Pseudoclavibacter endophyticus TaxID=1778590 RepID=A0A6H9WET2_9MICO|nr:hypothetical protein [Pseudoclavibacter endophyticus]KAB1649422.1 hypothetical protein F8O04_03925 [Pseudoclavibacter endophyticus]GGA62759.1 hypothetical protein GCM10011490_11530 [Pseudoclavibacter endophyticus]
MTTKQLALAQGTVNPIAGRRIGVVNAGTEHDRVWAKIMVVGGPSQIDVRIDEGTPTSLEGFGTITLVGFAEPADPERGRGPVIAVEIELADEP